MDGGENQEASQPVKPKTETSETPKAPESPQINFNDKFTLQTMEFSHGKVAFRDIKPESLREGGDIPLVMMTGWAMNQEVIGNTTKGLVEKGQRVIPLDMVGGGKSVEGNGDAAGEINRQALLLKMWMDAQEGTEKFRLLGQSMSALVLLALVENDPEMADKIQSIQLISPMGLAGNPSEHTTDISSSNPKVTETEPGKFEVVVGSPSVESEPVTKNFKGRVLDRFVKRVPVVEGLVNTVKRKFSEDARNAARPKTAEDAQIEPIVDKTWKSFLKNHPSRAFKEGIAMSRADEYNVLNLLKAKGIKVGIIQGADDQLNSSQGVIENISRQAAARSTVDQRYVDKRGLEKIPDNLQIVEDDSPEIIKEKQKAIIDLKLELQRTENRVPIDSLSMPQGGHEIFGKEATADTILRQIDNLEQPEKHRAILDENMRRNEELTRLHQEEEAKKAAAEELAEVRKKLVEETDQPKNAPESPQGS